VYSDGIFALLLQTLFRNWFGSATSSSSLVKKFLRAFTLSCCLLLTLHLYLTMVSHSETLLLYQTNCYLCLNHCTSYYLLCFCCIREGKSPDDKKTLHFLLNFLQISTIFASFSRAHAGTLQNHSISPCTTTVRNNTVESSTIFHSNLMLCINWFYEI
jgi:hypothetical protein